MKQTGRMGMCPTVSRHRYRLSGLVVDSGFALPARVAIEGDGDRDADVTLALGPVPERLDHPLHRAPTWMADQRAFLLDLPGIGRFLSEDGRRITVRPADGTALEDCLVFVTDTALAAILYQRGGFLLHAAAVVRDGRAHLICGQSGAGKSTLAAALVRAGCRLLADDVSTLDGGDTGPPAVLSDGRVLRLYRDSIAAVGLDAAVGSRVRRPVAKYHVQPPGPEAAVEAAPLAAVYVLSDAQAAAPAGIERLGPLEAAQALLLHTYRRRLALAYRGPAEIAARSARLLSHVPVFHLRRPRDFARQEETVTRLLRHVDERA